MSLSVATQHIISRNLNLNSKFTSSRMRIFWVDPWLRTNCTCALGSEGNFQQRNHFLGRITVMSSTISPQEIAARVGLDAKELEWPCEEGLFPSIANFVHPWRLVFADQLAPVDLDDVDLECHSEQEKRLGCLRKWKARRGAGATVGVVIESVLKSGSVDNAESMCRCLLPGAIVPWQKFGMTFN